MSGEHRKRRTLWVGDQGQAVSLREAAAMAGVPESSLYRLLRYSGECVVGGLRISEKPPRQKEGPMAEPVLKSGPLLRYPLGERPIERGLAGRWK